MPPEEVDESVAASQDDANLRGTLDQIKVIATGGMSQIFRARQPALDRFIAIKKLKEELLSNAEARERFRREAKALASVLHQNIAHVYDFVEGTRESYILMEFIDGVDLSMVIGRVGTVPPPLAAIILLGVSKGVSYIHTRGLIHRDIKPSNIRLNTHGEIKLMDFGIVVDTENTSLTRPGMMVGSPSYLSPEQVLGDAISPRSDIFLLGICLYEMLTGTKPFKEQAGETVFSRIRAGKYAPIKSVLPNVPAALERIVTKCLQTKPERRYSSVRRLIEDLEEFLGPHVSSHGESLILKFLDNEALLTPSVPSRDIEKAVHRRRSPVLIVVLAVLMAIIAGVVGYELGKEEGRSQQAEVRAKFGDPKPIQQP